MKKRDLALAVALTAAALIASCLPAAAAPQPVPAQILARGRTLVVYGSCNDCHTPNWREADGDVPTIAWMTGSKIGFRGWWGTSYPANVRLDFQNRPAASWIASVRTRAGHPPMVWQDLRELSDADLGAIYQFIRSLGTAGTVAPAAVEPWREPKTRFVDMRVFPAPKTR